MTTPDLKDVIKHVIGENGRFVKLSRGLCLKFRTQTPAGQKPNRLHVYRPGVAPSTKELIIVRQLLENLLPVQPSISEPWRYTSDAGVTYIGQTFEWQTPTEQPQLPGMEAAKRPHNYA